MAALIQQDALTRDQIKRLSKDLYFTPRFKRKPKYPVVGKDVCAVNFDEITSDIRIPLWYALENELPIVEFRHKSIQREFTGELFEHQLTAMAEILELIAEHRTVTLDICTGYGKTTLMTYLICQMGLLAAFIVPSETLISQTLETFVQRSNLRPWIVGEKNPPKEYDVLIVLVHRIKKIPEKVKHRIGLILVDEAHEYLTQIRTSDLLTFTPQCIVMATASLQQENQMERVIHSFVGKHAVIREPEPRDVIVLHTEIEFECEPNKQGNSDWDKLNKAIHASEDRNAMIIQLIKYLARTGEKIMVATIQVEHALNLYETLKNMKHSCDYLVGGKKKYEDCQIFIGGHKKVGTGFDQAMKAENYDGRQFKYLINCSSIKKESKLKQLVGRLRDKKGIFFQILDENGITQNHVRLNRNYYKQIKAPVTEMLLTDYIGSPKEEHDSGSRRKQGKRRTK